MIIKKVESAKGIQCNQSQMKRIRPIPHFPPKKKKKRQNPCNAYKKCTLNYKYILKGIYPYDEQIRHHTNKEKINY